jgi:protein-tyrosine phosphatase
MSKPEGRIKTHNAVLHYLHTQVRRLFGVNISQIEPLLFVGGQFRPDQWPQIYKRGVRAVLSLQAEYEDRFEGAPEPQALRLLVPDYHPPSIEQLQEAVSFIEEMHTQELPVFIHCHAGMGRAPLTAAAYLMQTRSWDHRQALKHIRHSRPIVTLNEIQMGRLLEWEAHLQKR